MLLDMMTRRPEDFKGITSAFSQWVLAQHHGLKTRLLDITRNPLVALYYACEMDPSSEGKLHVFAVPPALVKPYDSDTVSIIANFAKLSHREQNLLLGKRRGVDWDRLNYQEVLIKLYHLIGLEKPHFQRRIDPRDLFRILVVEPQQSIERVRAQSGAFLISAFHERLESSRITNWNSSIPVYEQHTLSIPPESKARILSELRLLNVTSETLLPGLDQAAKAIVRDQVSSQGKGVGAIRDSDNSTWHKSHPRRLNFKRPELPPELQIPPAPLDAPDLPSEGSLQQ